MPGYSLQIITILKTITVEQFSQHLELLLNIEVGIDLITKELYTEFRRSCSVIIYCGDAMALADTPNQIMSPSSTYKHHDNIQQVDNPLYGNSQPH